MPTYEYRCSSGHDFERFQKITAPTVTACPVCGSDAERRISTGLSPVFKGTGFYATDYKRSAAPSAE